MIKLVYMFCIMSEGKVVQFDTPDNILRHPANDFVRDFIGQNRLIQDRPNDKTVEGVMIKPITIQETMLNDAVHIMRQKRVDTIFVVDSDNHLLGFLDIEDINQGIRGHKSLRYDVVHIYTVQIDSKLQDSCTYDFKKKR
ncbi:CBS domain-containing protein [Staphylococcus aureus]